MPWFYSWHLLVRQKILETEDKYYRKTLRGNVAGENIQKLHSGTHLWDTLVKKVYTGDVLSILMYILLWMCEGRTFKLNMKLKTNKIVIIQHKNSETHSPRTIYTWNNFIVLLILKRGTHSPRHQIIRHLLTMNKDG